MDGRLQFNKVKGRRNEVPLINLYEVQVQYENDTYHEFGVYQSTRDKSNYQILLSLPVHLFFQATKHLTGKLNAPFEIVISPSFNFYSSRFVHNRCVGTLMARIGQCFSTSMDAVGIDVNEGTSWDMDEDIKTSDGSYCFSDGVGRISHSLAQQVTDVKRNAVFWSFLRSQ